jgi:hypothetical protein
MDRGLERDEDPRQDQQGTTPTASDRRDRTPVAPARPHFTLPAGRRREAVQLRDRTYRLRDTESRTLETAGVFRAVFTRDLEVGVYAGDGLRMARDLEALAAAGLIQRRPFSRGTLGQHLEVVTLTRDAQTLLEEHRVTPLERAGDSRQAIHSGFVRPTELLHDATLYRLFLEERDRLAGEGAVIERVVLDHELKGQLFREARLDTSLTVPERQAQLAAAAERLHLPVVDGHVQIPDLRLEIEDATGARTRVDLELATEAYRAGQLRAKAKAGFAVYRAVGTGGGRARLSLNGGTGGRGAAGDDRDLASRLLSL